MEKNFLGKSQFFIPVVGVMVGVLCASFSLSSVSFGLFLLFLGLVTRIFIFFFEEKNRMGLALLIPTLLFFSGIGIVRFHATDVLLPESFVIGDDAGIYGTVIREPRLREAYREYVLRGESGVRVLVRAEPFPEMVFGDRILARGVLSYPESFVTDSGRVFDYEAYLHKEGISFILSFAQTEKVGESKESLRSTLFHLKNAFLSQVVEAVPYPASSLAAGVLLGTEDALGSDLLDAFRTVGIIHIIVLSGYNITIVAESVLRVVAFLGRRRALLTAAFAVVLFSFMVGGSPSVVRAALMGLLVLLARATGRNYDVSRALAVAAGLMVLWNPRLLVFDLGFQLSFLATIAIIWIAPWFEKKLTIVPQQFGFRTIAGATIATQLFVLPMLIYASGTVSISGFVVNLLVLPVIPLLMLVSFVTGLLGFISLHLSLIPGLIVYGLGTYVISLSEQFAALPGSAVTAPTISGWFVILIYATFLVSWWYWKRKNITSLLP